MTKDENGDTPLMLAIRTYKKISALPNMEQESNSIEFMVTSLRTLEPQEHYPVSLDIIKILIKYGIVKIYVSLIAGVSCRVLDNAILLPFCNISYRACNINIANISHFNIIACAEYCHIMHSS